MVSKPLEKVQWMNLLKLFEFPKIYNKIHYFFSTGARVLISCPIDF